MTFTVGSLFAGIGGFDLSAERAGMVVKWQCEIDDFCNKVLAKHWPNVARYRDVKEVHGIIAHAKRGRCNTSRKELKAQDKDRPSNRSKQFGKNEEIGLAQTCSSCLPAVDLICGGFPCQPHSVAGKRKGKEDDRDLWPEYLRIIKEVRPRWVVGENVPGIITTILDQVLSDLEGADYTAETLIIPAVSFNAPHRRDRVFVVAHSNSSRKSPSWKNNRMGRERKSLENIANPSRSRLAQWNGSGPRQTQPAPEFGDWWNVEPGMGRVAHGVPNRVDRLRSLGNAIVPQVAEFIFRNIMEVERVTNDAQ